MFRSMFTRMLVHLTRRGRGGVVGEAGVEAEVAAVAGVGLRLIAFSGTVFIGIVMLILFQINYAAPKKREFLIQFNCRLVDDKPPYLPVLDKYCRKHRLVNMQSIGESDFFEISFYVVLKNKKYNPLLIQDLNNISEINQVRFFFDEV